MMYDELVKELRDTERICRDRMDGTVMLQAADAIENVSKAYQMMAEAYEAEVAKQDWIPVMERLPQEYEDVLCYYEYFRYGDHNCMFRAIDRGYYVGGRWGGEAGQGLKNKVLYWMPLPEPPKEETDPCADCRYYPASSTDGKPCCACDPYDPLMNCREAKEET